MREARANVNPSTRDTPGFWPWFLQRISSLLLLVLILLHGWINHFLPISDVEAGLQDKLVIFDVVAERLAQGAFVALDIALLTLVLYHGLNGVRGILLEWGPTARRARTVTSTLWTIGAATFAYAVWSLWAFMAA
ncbi:MAG: hypothetical protein QF717_09680 [SAR202 cluster bacterium]|jgi:succinate dehydrogenase/fumarate reductase cytochrome b subunit|nr:hypothetical protein [SAR202 cluster bacterium]MDP7103448.1 hypothetical protein [SAR202 cluster bacterium]HJO83153.1 hypothetical protein [SAR202 cluster bacterium]|tara:strand:+ start:3732 stop:4136 length:405 start_codon:yes stop_codon:yes gene_type:complete